MVLATLIAGVGILTDSVILIIGAMVVGPEFGPLAGSASRSCSAAWCSPAGRSWRWPSASRWRSQRPTLGTLLLRAVDRGPDELADHPATLFISHPELFSLIVAVLAGIAGVLSLSTAKSGALIGVLISVTTIPAAANVGVAAAYRDWDEFGGAAFQLGINLIAIVACRRRHARDPAHPLRSAQTGGAAGQDGGVISRRSSVGRWMMSSTTCSSMTGIWGPKALPVTERRPSIVCCAEKNG